MGLSDWTGGYGSAGSNAPGETTAFSMQSSEIYAGGTNSLTGPGAFLYGYIVPTNPGKTITSLVLPNDPFIAILAIDEIMQPSQLNLSGYFDAVGITTTGSTVSGPFNSPAGSSGASYSSTAIGSTITWNSQTFNLGTAGQNNVVLVGGTQIARFPPETTPSIKILAASTHGGTCRTRSPPTSTTPTSP